MSLIEDAISVLFPNMPVKFVQCRNSPLDYEAFARTDANGNILGVVISDEPHRAESGKVEVKTPIAKTGELVFKLVDTKDISTKTIDTATGEIKPKAVKP